MNNLRFPFPGCERLKRNFSQAHQDLFTLSALDGKRGGTFLEIGAFHPWKISNTFLLEHRFGWDGISIDRDKECAPLFARRRRCRFLLADATEADYRGILSEYGGRMDYLSLDIEPAEQTFACLLRLPLDAVRFSVITFEHDAYQYGDMVRRQSRRLLAENGYERVVSNIQATEGYPFEDWYLDPQAISPHRVRELRRDGDGPVLSSEYMLR
jgi:hypothetical protein